MTGATINRTTASIATELAIAKASARANVNGVISDLRLLFITDLPGQSMIYKEKEDEAVRYKAAVMPNVSDYPWIEKEVGITAGTAEGVADVFIALAEAWRTVGSSLEQIRVRANTSIAAATSVAMVATATATFTADVAAFRAANGI